METQPKLWKCPHPDCLNRREFKSQGKGGHLYSIHGVRTEKELLDVMSGKEIRLLPDKPEHVSQTETITRVAKHVSEIPVITRVQTRVTDTCQTPINIE